MTGTFDVDASALRTYGGALGGYAARTKGFSDQVQQADVGDESWGIVGLFTKNKYTDTINSIQDFLRSAEQYAAELDEKMVSAGDTYDTMDRSTSTVLNTMNKSMGGSISPYGQSVGGTAGLNTWRDFGADNYAQQQDQLVKSKSGEQDVSSMMSDGSSFIDMCMGAMGGSSFNPLSMLASAGLDFLLQVVQPLQDLLEMVSGDPEALDGASKKFLDIEQGLLDLRAEFTSSTRQALVSWAGDAAGTAKQRLTELGSGLGGAAGKSGSLAELLAMSSVVMEAIYELLKSILTEIIVFLIELWLPALAAAATTFGASIAAATATTTVKTTQTVASTTQKVSKLSELLKKLVKVLAKLAYGAAQKYSEFKDQADQRRAQGEATRNGVGQTPGVNIPTLPGTPRPGTPGYPGGNGGNGGYNPSDPYTPRPYDPYNPPSFDPPDVASPGARPPLTVPDRGSYDWSSSDYDPADLSSSRSLSSGTTSASFDPTSGGGSGVGGGGGFGAGGAGPTGASLAPGRTSDVATPGMQSGAAGQTGGAGARPVAGGAAGMGRGGMGGGMMGGAGGGRGQGSEDAEHQRKALLQEDDPDELFGLKGGVVPPVIGE